MARSVKMLVRADSLSRSMSHYLVERIKTIPNITVEPNTEVIAVHGESRLTGLSIRHHDTQTTEERAGRCGIYFYWRGAADGMARRNGVPRWKRISDHGAEPVTGWKTSRRLDFGSRSVVAGNQRAGSFLRWAMCAMEL